MNESELTAAASSSVDEDALLAELRLSLAPGIGPLLRKALLERFHTAQRVFSASRDSLQSVPGIGPKLARAILESVSPEAAQAELDLCRTHAVRLLLAGATDYPRALTTLPDAPALLYCRGDVLERDHAAVAIVGSRHATQYGRIQAERFAAGLARAGLTVVSGLARGVDAAAHRGALEAGGRTIAVLGSGVLEIYPPEHKELAEQVASQGAVLSESHLHAKPLSGAFPQRNRLISGLSLGVLVIEASARSGALITARHAGEQGRDVFALPGRVDSRMSQGCHALLRDGARLVTNVDELLEELGYLHEPVQREDGPPLRRPAELLLNEVETQVLAAVSEEPTTVDQVIAKSGLTPPRVLSVLSVLEMRKVVRRVSGNWVQRT